MDPRVTEFHSIMPIANVASVMQRGILGHELAAKLRRKPAALPTVPDRRAHAHVPGGLKLHQYANLYFHARNPLLFRLRGDAESLCILRLSVNVLDIRDVALADGDAASEYVRFLSPAQWEHLRLEEIFTPEWEHPGDLIAGWRQAALKCAEVLAPESVEPEFVIGAYVASETAGTLLKETGFAKRMTVDPWLFFAAEAVRDGA